MERTIMERIIFISVFLTIIFSMHLYSFLRLSSLFGLERKAWHYGVLFLLATSIIFATILSSFYTNPAAKILYMFAACWFGIQFLFFSAALIYEIPRLFIRGGGPTAGKAIVLIVALSTMASIINARFTRVKKVEIPSFGARLNAVQLSDLHIGTIWGKDYLQKIVDATNSLEPDVIFITGDIVSGAAVLRKEVFEPLADLEARSFFVNGNHEHYDGAEEIAGILTELGITVLCDEKAEFNGIEIVGVDYRENGERIASVLGDLALSNDTPTILLTHAPINPENERVELILAGHTHSGQIFPFNFIIWLRYKYINGLYALGNTSLYVSPGTNTWGPPMRLGSRNEITLLQLR